MAISYDLVLLHAPSIYDFRKTSVLTGPISDVVPSSPIFEMYPIGLTSIGEFLEEYGFKVKVINIANRMLMNPNFDVEKKLKNIKTKAFGIDLHWAPHAHGSIELAKVVKKLHPTKPIIFGGLSATYFHDELIDYDCVDFVVRGDSTEKLMLLLIDRICKGTNDFNNFPNLTWKVDKKKYSNPLTYVPTNYDDLNVPGYRYIVRSVFKYWNLYDPLPYNGWLEYPNTALLSAKGCTNNCIICGGSKDASAKNTCRTKISKRSPKRLIDDMQFVQRFSRAPIFILGDIRQCGKEYVDEFFSLAKNAKIKNEIVLELFQYAPESFYKNMHESFEESGYSIEITLETHDENIRRHNGKMICSNKKLIETLQFALKHGCKKIDLFFMTGIPDQTYESALQNIDFVEKLHTACGNNKKLTYFIAPLAPFLDPACRAFEEPEKYGYIKHCHTLWEHREIITAPSWKYILSYETNFMTRDDIVNATYDSAFKLNEFKLKHGLVDKTTYEDVKTKIIESKKYIAEIDRIMLLPEKEKTLELNKIQEQVKNINRHSIAGKDELKWRVKKNYASFFTLARLGLSLFVQDVFFKNKKKEISLVEREILTKKSL